MNWIGNAFILGFALAMDCLALSVADGLVYGKEKKRKYFFIAGVFGLFQGLMPLIGFLLGQIFAETIDKYDHWIGFTLLLLIGGKMVFDGIKGLFKPETEVEQTFSYPKILLQGVADSIDALAIGITMYSNLGLDVNNVKGYEIYIGFLIIALMSFVISLIGLFGGRVINRLLKGKISLCNLIGGIILILLGVFLLLKGLSIINL